MDIHALPKKVVVMVVSIVLVLVVVTAVVISTSPVAESHSATCVSARIAADKVRILSFTGDYPVV